MSALAWIAAIAMAADVAVTLFVAPTLAGFNAPLTSRLLYWHVPSAWIAYAAFGVAAAASAAQLRRPGPRADAYAVASAEAGVLFATIALVTGLLWSTQEFGGSYRAAQDPAVLALAFLILSYVAYFALRASIEERPRRRRLAAVYGILAFIGVPLSYLAIRSTVHPDFTRPDQALAPELRAYLLGSALAIGLLYAALVQARARLALAEDRALDRAEVGEP